MWNLTRRSRRTRPTDRQPTLSPIAPSVSQDLVKLGVSPAFAASAAERLGTSVLELDPEAYAALLRGIAVAHGVRDESDHASETEVQKLVSDFAVELQKLDEGLKLLSAYLLRLRKRNGAESSPPTVH